MAARALAIAGAILVPRWTPDPALLSDPLAALDLARGLLARERGRE